MAKTVPPGVVQIPGVGEMIANAVPDTFDERDLPYRPRLEPLAPTLDQRDLDGCHVLLQQGQSCTGHALATVINTVLARLARPARVRETGGNGNGRGRGARRGAAPRVSPYMLYRLARRYDEFDGEDDSGSSLRGGLKGWFHHGVALEADWPKLDPGVEPDLDDPGFIGKCRDRPLGAFYRVNAFRLDELQSAINELHAIAVSARIHDGWVEPVRMQHGQRTMRLVRQSVNARSLGGHAFALVGYNDVGFLVQNSWGADWGRHGFATLPYEDWLDNAYDAWVVRPGVPQTPFADGRPRSARGTGGVLATGRGPDLKRLERHVVNLGNQGRLSTNGVFTSSPAQIERIFERMAEWHDAWAAGGPGTKRDVVLFAHGGLVSEGSGLEIAQRHLNWWLNNRVFPVYFAWQSGPAETLVDQLADTLEGKLPFGGIGFDLVEQFDRLVEKLARSNFRWMWDEMKENARAASEPIGDPGAVQWPPRDAHAAGAMAGMPGASLTITRLRRYVDQHGADDVRIHLVGHSAGAIFLASLVQRLAEAKLRAESLTLLAPAIRVDEFAKRMLPHVGPDRTVARFATFAMSDQRELNDRCGKGRISIYQKSLLYLVSRAFERAAAGDVGGEVRLLGMEKFFDRPADVLGGQTLRGAIAQAGGACVFSRSAAPAECRSDATTHGGFDDDAPTMTSVVMRVLGVREPTAVNDYVPNAALNPLAGAPAGAAPSTPAAAGTRRARAPRRGAGEPVVPVATTRAPGAPSVEEAAEPQLRRPVVPPSGAGVLPEVAVAPLSGSSVVDMLIADGWEVGETAPPRPAGRAAGRRRGTAPTERRSSRRRTERGKEPLPPTP